MVSLFFELGLIRPISCTVIYLLAVTGWVSLDHILFYILFSVASFILRVFFFFTVLYEVLLFIVVCRISRISQIQWKPFLSFLYLTWSSHLLRIIPFFIKKLSSICTLWLYPSRMAELATIQKQLKIKAGVVQRWGDIPRLVVCEDWHSGEGITRRWRSIAKKL